MNCYGTKSADFLKKNPPGLLPVILLDGELVTEHVRIMFLLEETFQAPYTKLIPTEENDKMQAFHRFMRLERVLTGAWLTVLRTPVQLLSVAKPQLTNALTLVEESLAEFSGPFFLGQEPSFVDIMFSSILERTKATIKYFRNWDVSEGHPNLTTWYAAMKSWESARFISADEYSSALSIPPQIGSVTFMRERNDISLGVDARRSLYMLNDGPESQEPREEAAERLCSNLTAVVQDARKGARLDERLGPLLSTVLRIVASALIHPDKLEESEQNMKEVVVGEDVRRIVSALMFIRQRCCCPRDMTVDALEQFCGALNCFIRLLEPDAS